MINFDVPLTTVFSMPPGTVKAALLATYGLTIDGAHHKQWFLEQIIESLGVSLPQLREQAIKGDWEWEAGIAP